jgi:hypothetical protein
MTTIDFQRICRKAFAFLEDTYGCQPTMSGDGIVQYDCGLVTVTIRYDYRQSYELEAEFALLGQVEPAFSLGEVLLLNRGVMPQAVQVTTEEALERFIHEMAQLVGAHAIDVLNGSPSEFDRLSEQRKRVFKRQQEEQRREDAIHTAQEAWEKRDYFEVVRLLSPIEAELSPSKTKLLELARNRIGSGLD